MLKPLLVGVAIIACGVLYSKAWRFMSYLVELIVDHINHSKEVMRQ